MTKQLPPQALLRRLFSYDILTGDLVWNYNADYPIGWNTRLAGTIAGKTAANGYLHIEIGGHGRFLAHRLIWQMVFGSCPEFLDHKNGVRTDNRIQNLRPATRSQNNVNRRVPARSLPRGVSFHQSTGLFRARTKRNGKEVMFGLFRTPQAAAEAHAIGVKRVHGEFAPC